jgi:arylsulfatase A-like enzyme
MNLSRRHFFFGSLALPALAAKKPAGETPNIVLVLAENLPAWMLGSYGNKEVQTPNIDRLGQTGTRFSNHFAGSPLSRQARACLLTGQTAVQLNDATAPPDGAATLDKLMGAAGYACQPVTGGPDAVKFIDAQSAAKPFLLTVTLEEFTAPYAAAAKYLDRYSAAKFETFSQVPPAANIARDKEMFGGNLLPSLRRAAAAATALDAEVGTLLAKLSQKKLLDNTLIIFTAPTGSLLGRHGLWGGGDASNPINFFEEVVATPMIWTWPARVPPLAVRPELVSALDLVPTLCDLTPADLTEKDLAGRSYLLPVTNKPLPKKEPWRQTAFVTNADAGVARDDRYKLVLRNEGKGPNELYDIRSDPRETVNQADNPQFLTVKTQLGGELTRWRQKYGPRRKLL